MPLTYSTAYDLTALAPALQRTTIACVKAATDIYAEPSPAAPRKALAVAVLNDPDKYGKAFLFSCTVDPTIVAKTPATVTDADLLNAVKLAWNGLAGV